MPCPLRFDRMTSLTCCAEAANVEEAEERLIDQEEEYGHSFESDAASEPQGSLRTLPLVTNPIRIGWERFRDLMYDVSASKSFNYLTVFVILLNTINLGIVW